MNEKKLNDELTIIGLIFFLAFVTYYLYSYVNYALHLEAKVTEAQKTAIYLDKRLSKTEDTLIQTNQNLISLQSTIENYKSVEKITKEIDRNWPESK